MKTLFKVCIALLVFSFTTVAVAEGWSIPSLDVDVTVNTDGSITVRETIVADFTKEAHHGIYRHIPVRYQNPAGIRLNLRLQVISVTNGEGKSWWYSRSRKGDSVYLKIGDKSHCLIRSPSGWQIIICHIQFETECLQLVYSEVFGEYLMQSC